MFRISDDNGAGGDWIRGEPSLSSPLFRKNLRKLGMEQIGVWWRYFVIYSSLTWWY